MRSLVALLAQRVQRDSSTAAGTTFLNGGFVRSFTKSSSKGRCSLQMDVNRPGQDSPNARSFTPALAGSEYTYCSANAPRSASSGYSERKVSKLRDCMSGEGPFYLLAAKDKQNRFQA